MKAYKWELAGFPILLECSKEDANAIINRFGMNAKGRTLQIEENRKVSFYGLNVEKKVVAPVTSLSIILSGHEIPEIGPEITVALFLDEYRLVNMWEFHQAEIQKR